MYPCSSGAAELSPGAQQVRGGSRRIQSLLRDWDPGVQPSSGCWVPEWLLWELQPPWNSPAWGGDPRAAGIGTLRVPPLIRGTGWAGGEGILGDPCPSQPCCCIPTSSTPGVQLQGLRTLFAIVSQTGLGWKGPQSQSHSIPSLGREGNLPATLKGTFNGAFCAP